MRILLVDDNVSVLEVLFELATSMGHKVSISMSGRVAASKLEKEEYDLVISDFNMRNGDGAFLLGQVKKLHKKPHFYFFTAQEDIDKKILLDEGADKYFEKPFGFIDLKKELAHFMEEGLEC